MNDDQFEILFGLFTLIFGSMFFLFCLALGIVVLVAWWKIFTKAGKPGWAAIIPVYNIIVLLEITGRPIWWIALYLIPLVNLGIAIVVNIDLAKSFGKSAGFGVGLVLLSFIFYPILGFGDARYLGPSAGGGGTAPSPQWTPQA